MLDLFKSKPGATTRPDRAIRLENLEDRAVPAMFAGMGYDGALQQQPATPPVVEAQPVVQTTTQTQAVVAPPLTYAPPASATLPALPSKSVEVSFDMGMARQTRTLNLPQFDPSQGTLAAVAIKAEGAIQNRTIVENLSSREGEIELKLQGTIGFQLPGAQQLTATVTRQVTGTAGAFDGQMDLQGTSAKDFGVVNAAGSFNTATVTDANALAAYIGTGTVNVTQTSEADACTCGPGDFISRAATQTGGKVTVTYYYNPPPPPPIVTPPPPVQVVVPPPTPFTGIGFGKYFFFGGAF